MTSEELPAKAGVAPGISPETRARIVRLVLDLEEHWQCAADFAALVLALATSDQLTDDKALGDAVHRLALRGDISADAIHRGLESVVNLARDGCDSRVTGDLWPPQRAGA